MEWQKIDEGSTCLWQCWTINSNPTGGAKAGWTDVCGCHCPLCALLWWWCLNPRFTKMPHLPYCLVNSQAIDTHNMPKYNVSLAAYHNKIIDVVTKQHVGPLKDKNRSI